MDVEALTRRAVDRRLDRLEAEYGSFPVCEVTVQNSPEFFAEGRAKAESGWIGDAGAWVVDPDDRVLLIRHEGAPDTWGTPGGGHEPGETLAETARREVREETGVECELTAVDVARHKTVEMAQDPTERFHMLTVIFDATCTDVEISIGDEEVLEASWFSDPPDSVHDFVQNHVTTW